MTNKVKQTVEEIRLRNQYRRRKQTENKQLGFIGKPAERRRTKPSPIQDVETLLKILDGVT